MAIILNEPTLEFKYGQRVQDPRDGLTLFGPFDSDKTSKPRAINYVVLGTPEGIALFNQWSSIFNRPAIFNGNLRLWIPFPGFEAAFGASWPEMPQWTHPIDRTALLNDSNLREKHDRAYKVVSHYIDGLRIANTMDEKIDVAICIVPDEVWKNCRPESRVINPVGEQLSKNQLKERMKGQLDFFDEYDPDQYLLSPDFRRQLKARSMEFDIPIQIIKESTLRPNDDNIRGQRQLTPLSDRMWNLGTALYYKSGGKPWKLNSAREGVCYIGIAFRLTGQGNTACCAAQMFLDTGDGVVFKGEYGPWYSPSTEQFHLSREAAKNLLEGVLKTYRELGGKELTEIFLHSRSSLYAEEFEGYSEACPPGVKVIGIRVQPSRDKIKVFRPGKMPVMRGTFWKLSDTSGLLWTNGFKPRIATYDGWEIPVPLRIDIQYGDAVIERVAQDILGLTKLNYNACRMGDKQPVTVGFSDAVGEILVSNPPIVSAKPNFKFYI